MCELVHLLSEYHVIWSSGVIVTPHLLTYNPFSSRPRPTSHARDRELLLPTPYSSGSFKHTPGSRPVPGAPHTGLGTNILALGAAVRPRLTLLGKEPA